MTRLTALVLLLSACDPLNGHGRNGDSDADTDTFEDVDTLGDTGTTGDTDTEADTEPDTDADTEPDADAPSTVYDLPDGMCDDTDDCGVGGTCVDGACVCDDGFIDCDGGCRELTTTSTPLADVSGDGVAMTYAPNGTAYVLIREEVGTLDFALRLFSLAPSASSFVQQDFTADVHFRDRAFDAVVRSDGTLFVIVASGSNQARLFEWTPTETDLPYRVLGAGPASVGVGITVDNDDTIWASWATNNSSPASHYSRTLGGLNTQYSNSSFRSSAEADIEFNPATNSVVSFWGHRYTGNYVNGLEVIDGSAPSGLCDGTDVAFAPDGDSWSVFNTYSDIRGVLCYNGVDTPVADATVRDPFPRSFLDAAIVTTRDGTAVLTHYDRFTDRAHWAASRDGERWSQGVVPALYDNTIAGGDLRVTVARRPRGGVGVFVLPNTTDMGNAALVEMR